MRTGNLIIMTLVALFTVTATAADLVDRIVAVVNHEIITLSDLDRTLEPFIKNLEKSKNISVNEETINEARKAALNGLINNMLIDQEAARLGIVVTDEDLDKTLHDILHEKQLSLSQLKDMLAQNNTTMEDYKEDMRRQIVKMRLIGKEIRSKIGVSKEEIGEYYAKHRSVYEGKESVRVQQILIIAQEDADKEKRSSMRERANKVLEFLRRGESFEQIATEYSQGPAAQDGGDLGFIEKGIMLPEVDKEAFRLAKGEISNVIESHVGFHIIKIIDKRGSGVKPLEDVRDEIKESIVNEKAKIKFEKWIQELRKKSLIEIRLDQ
ncbi:MAG: peptidylprolyl isomerase [Deltaproteobacteria bacterium]|nr:peptidylprolyl isomerase [Deltaproteobacteria bacterium]